MDDYKDFAQRFRLWRTKHLMTQSTVASFLQVSQTAICRLEKACSNIRIARTMIPVMRKWIAQVEENRRQGKSAPAIACQNPRKKRAQWNPDEKQLLLEYYEKRSNTPKTSELDGLCKQLGRTQDEVRNWFSNQRQARKLREKRSKVS